MKVRRLREDELCHNTTNVRRLNTDELYHHGIKGQRWGVRRYQNEDGSLTEAGKARYYKFFNDDGSRTYSGDRHIRYTQQKYEQAKRSKFGSIKARRLEKELADLNELEKIAKQKEKSYKNKGNKSNKKESTKSKLTIKDIDDDELVDIIMLEKDPKVFKEYNIDEATYNKWKKNYYK